EHLGHSAEALRFFLVAADLGPELKDVHYRLARLFRAAGRRDAAEAHEDYLYKLQGLEQRQDQAMSAASDPVAMAEMVDAYRKAGRIWEAFGWAKLALRTDPRQELLLRAARELTELTRELPLTLVSDRFSGLPQFRVADIRFPETRSGEADTAEPVVTRGESKQRIHFTDIAAEIGLRFRFVNGVRGPTTHRMFEFTGGGIGVGDFDRDSYPDLFLTQGGLWESRGRSDDAADRLFRNIRGQVCADATAESGIVDRSFGQGTGVGDLNEDGFPDAVISNIGPNTLWVNMGDGTFRSQPFPESSEHGSSSETWSASAVIADLTCDGISDVYVCNYLQGADVFERICRGPDGSPRACIPVHFEPAVDTFLIGNGDGTFRDGTSLLSSVSPGKGLGLLAWRPGPAAPFSLLVANDTTPNMLLQFSEHGGPVTDAGFASGLAVDAFGKAQGCMGIAAADINGDQICELVVTNFYNEGNAFYVSRDGTSFEDRSRSSGLEDLSLPLLGFGTRFIDADGDSSPELFIANGHVDDLRSEAKPYRMLPQLLRTDGTRFLPIAAESAGDYFLQPHLGRAAAVIDWNRDLCPDLVVGHLDEAYALLKNDSPGTRQAVTVTFSATNSARDAFGTRVVWTAGASRLTHQLMAGDGYQTSSQKLLFLNRPESEKSGRLRVEWPSGRVQSVETLPGSRQIILREGCESVFEIPK
ncbi:MAG: CRTAC1 family protein, partial [Planctomycetaceae bacterium]|nr:CRTAC1 family protein [Planctomycetaceae bacterium]